MIAPYRILQVLFATVALVSGLFIAFGLVQGPAGLAPLPAPRPLPVVNLNDPIPNHLKSLESYAAIYERPVFSPTRQPLRTLHPVKSDDNWLATQGLVLTGVLIQGDEKHVLIKTSESETEQRLKEGDTIKGWQIDTILLDRVELSNNGKTAVIPIWDAKKAGAAATKAGKRKKKPTARKGVPRSGTPREK
jgi:type II secretory pathway component PulC